MLKQAVAAYMEEEFARLPSEDEIGEHHFSPEFEQKMEALLTRGIRPYRRRTAGKRVAVLAAVIALLAACMLSVGAVRESIVSFFTEVYEEFTAIIFEQPEESVQTDAAVSIDEIEITYIPEGFEVNQQNRSAEKLSVEYTDNEVGYIIVDQRLLGEDGIGLNTEDVEYQIVEVNGQRGVFYENRGYATLMWNDAKQYFIVSGNINKEEIIKIAESIKIIEKTK